MTLMASRYISSKSFDLIHKRVLNAFIKQVLVQSQHLVKNAHLLIVKSKSVAAMRDEVTCHLLPPLM